MGRKVMDSGFRRIKKSTPVVDPAEQALALVAAFAASQPPVVETTQEPAEEPVADESVNSPVEVSEAADEAQVKPEPVLEPVFREPVARDKDFDPIAAVLG